MIAKTPNIRCFVAKTHLSRFTHFFRQQMSPFYPFRGKGGSPKGDNVTFFYRFLYQGFPMAYICPYILCDTFLIKCDNSFGVNKFATLSPGSGRIFWSPWLHLLFHRILQPGEPDL